MSEMRYELINLRIERELDYDSWYKTNEKPNKYSTDTSLGVPHLFSVTSNYEIVNEYKL